MAKWQICPICEGEGQSSAYLGAFTASDMEEAGQEFIEDYVSGFYDRSCATCSGTGKVTEEMLDARADRRENARLAWMEDGCPEGSFSSWYGEG